MNTCTRYMTEGIKNPIPDSVNVSIALVLKDDHLRLVGKTLYPVVFESDMMFPLQRQCELEKMMIIAQETKPETVFEIGTDKAGGLYHWIKCQPTVKNVIACEIRGTPYRELFEKAFPHLNFLWLDGVSSFAPKSVALVVSWLKELETKIGCMFIDGNKHKFEIDFNAYLPHMQEHGVVFMHDVQKWKCHLPVRKSWDNIIKRGFNTEEIVIKTDSDEALSRQTKGIPPANAHEGWLRHWYGRSCGVGVIRL